MSPISFEAREDSAFLAALDHPDHVINLTDDRRLTIQGYVAKDSSGRLVLTSDGVAMAERLRSMERDLIADDILAVIVDKGGPRADMTAEGWIVGSTWYAQRVYLEYTSPFDVEPLCAALEAKLGSPVGVERYSARGALRVYLGALRPSPRNNYAQLGEPCEDRDERVSAMHHADANWSDLTNDHGRVSFGGDSPEPPTGLMFHYASRTVLLHLDSNSRYAVSIGRSGDPDAGRSWVGHRADAAFKAMARDLYGTPCAHGYGTGRDSCPGCDASGETFENSHPNLKAMPSSTPPLTQVVTEGREPMLTVHHVVPVW